MNETSLKVFMAVCETGSFTKAAGELFITQPAVSRHVQSLEHHYGVDLFERRGRSIVLTPNGEILRAKARELFAMYGEVESLFDDLVELRRGKVTLTASATVATYLLPPAIASFREQFPGVAIEQLSGNTHLVKQMVADGEAELGFGGGAGVDSKRLIRALVHKERLVIVTRTDSEICKKAVVTPEDMLGYEFVWREKGTPNPPVRARAVQEHADAESGRGGQPCGHCQTAGPGGGLSDRPALRGGQTGGGRRQAGHPERRGIRLHHGIQRVRQRQPPTRHGGPGVPATSPQPQRLLSLPLPQETPQTGRVTWGRREEGTALPDEFTRSRRVGGKVPRPVACPRA